jgi:hypothetical protein
MLHAPLLVSTHLQEQHDIAFRATKSDLRRLLKGEEEAPNQALEALNVLRGSGRFLRNCEDGNGNSWSCDEDTHECGNSQDDCKEVCDEDKDCHDNGKCKKGTCDCYRGYEDKKDCSKRDVEFHIIVTTEGTEGERSSACKEALSSLEKDIESLGLPSTVTATSSNSRRTRNRHLKKSSSGSGDGALEIPLFINADRVCTRTGLVTQALEQLVDNKLIKLKNKKGGSRDI